MRLGPAGLLLVVAVGCSTSPSRSAPSRGAPSLSTPNTTLPPTTVPATALVVSGVGPGVEQAPFYPTISVGAIACGSSPHGPFLEIAVPPGRAGTPPNSALGEATSIVIIPGRAVLKDHTGKVLYEDDESDLTTPRVGSFVVSLASVTYIGGDGRAVEQGAVNVSGSYGCPAAPSPYPGA